MKYLSHKVQSKLSLGIAIKEFYGFKVNKSDVCSVQTKNHDIPFRVKSNKLAQRGTIKEFGELQVNKENALCIKYLFHNVSNRVNQSKLNMKLH